MTIATCFTGFNDWTFKHTIHSGHWLITSIARSLGLNNPVFYCGNCVSGERNKKTRETWGNNSWQESSIYVRDCLDLSLKVVYRISYLNTLKSSFFFFCCPTTLYIGANISYTQKCAQKKNVLFKRCPTCTENKMSLEKQEPVGFFLKFENNTVFYWHHSDVHL